MNEKDEKAQALLLRAYYALDHQSDCASARFSRQHKRCPSNHPIWNSASKCDCLMGEIADFLKLN